MAELGHDVVGVDVDARKVELLERVQRQVRREECFGTFNMGVGFVLIAPAAEAEALRATLNGAGAEAFVLGHMESGPAPLQLI